MCIFACSILYISCLTVNKAWTNSPFVFVDRFGPIAVAETLRSDGGGRFTGPIGSRYISGSCE
ncbi:hypothetical protein AAMO2058_001282800 [Amorphochlora amoebiformis]